MSKILRMSLSDLIILVAATALGLGLTRPLPAYVAKDWYSHVYTEIGVRGGTAMSLNNMGHGFAPAGPPLDRRPSYWLSHVPYWTGPCLAIWTYAALLMGPHGPGRWPSRLARRQGMAAGLALTLALAFKLVQCLQLSIGPGVSLSRDWQVFYNYFWTSLPDLAGYSVGASWLTLALSGRWSVGSGGGERLGVALGWCWIVMAVSSEVGVWCFALGH